MVAVALPTAKETAEEVLVRAVAFEQCVSRAVCRVNGSSSPNALGAIESCAYCPMSIGLSRSVAQ